jgi:L-threonylcarbamoyladenylate synthase
MFDIVAPILMKPGAIAIIPTDTVYGVVARADDPAAVARLYDLKHRKAKPGTVIAASIEQLEALGVKRRYLKAVEQFWPGAVSVIIPCGPELEYLYKGKNGLAIRIPNNAALQALLWHTGPLLTTSANLPGEQTAQTIAQAKASFGQEVDCYIDGGDYADRPPSTIVRIIDDAIEVVRQGAVELNLGG